MVREYISIKRGRGCWRILPKIEWTDFYRWCWFPDIPSEVEFVIGLLTNSSEGSHKQQPSKYCSVEVCVERHSLLGYIEFSNRLINNTGLVSYILKLFAL